MKWVSQASIAGTCVLLSFTGLVIAEEPVNAPGLPSEQTSNPVQLATA